MTSRIAFSSGTTRPGRLRDRAGRQAVDGGARQVPGRTLIDRSRIGQEKDGIRPEAQRNDAPILRRDAGHEPERITRRPGSGRASARPQEEIQNEGAAPRGLPYSRSAQASMKERNDRAR